MSDIKEIFFDLVSVPGLQTIILFNCEESPVVHQIGNSEETSKFKNERVLRGVGQIVRQLRGSAARVELRGTKGRFIIRTLGIDSSIVCVTDEYLNIPLLELALESYAQAAVENYSAAVTILRNGEMTRQSAPPAIDLPGEILPRTRAAQTAKFPSEIGEYSAVGRVSTKPTQAARINNSEPALNATSPDHQHSKISESKTPVLAASMSATNSVAPVLPSNKAKESFNSFVSANRDTQQQLPNPKNGFDQSLTFLNSAPIPPIKTIEELVESLNEISSIAIRFLGRSVVANYWRQTQPTNWRGRFDVSMNGKISILNFKKDFNPDDFETGQNWVKKFVARCQIIVVDIASELNANLKAQAATLLNAK